MNRREANETDAAVLLYRYSFADLLISIIAVCAVEAVLIGVSSGLPNTWCIAMATVLAFRAIDTCYLSKSRFSPDKRRFACGLIASAALWAIIPVVFFQHLTLAGRASIGIILSAIAGASTTILAASPTLATICCAALVLPASACFLLLPGAENTILGAFESVFFLALAMSSRVAHRALMTADRLTHSNEGLAADIIEERALAKRLTSELQTVAEKLRLELDHSRRAQSALEWAQDLAELRVSQRTHELEEEHTRLQAILENIPIGVLVAEAPSGRVLMANPQFTRMLDRETKIGSALVDVCRVTLREPDGGVLDISRHPFMRVLTNREIMQGEEYVHERANGRLSWLRVSGAPVVTSAGQTIAAVLIVDDIDAQKRAEQELRRSNDELRQFAYAAAHDLQEPLRNISIFNELLEASYKDRLDDEARQFIKFSVDGAQRMHRLVRDLLVYTKVVDHADFTSTLVPTNEILQQVLSDLKTVIEESRAQITAEMLPNVPVKEVHLQQLLHNLLSNALKYRGTQPPQVLISAQKTVGGWCFCIEDNGIGVAPEYHCQIFGVFKRLHGRQYEGTGIGLALCKRIVEHYGGRIWLQSQVGAGSRFFFTVPQGTATHVCAAN